MTLTSIRPSDPRWEPFVRAHPDASVYHLPAWAEILRRAYGFRSAAVAMEREDGSLGGIFPLMARKRPLTGARLRSLPMVPGGGPLACTDAVRDELIAGAAEVARASGYVLFFRSGVPGLESEGLGVGAVDEPPLRVLDLPDDYDAWLRERPKRLIRGVKRAAKDGVTVRLAPSEDDLRSFYGVYLEAMRKHRAAPRSFAQLQLARRLLGEHHVLFLAEREGQVIAGGVFHRFNGTLELLYNGSSQSTLEHRPNHALYAHVVQWARAAGLQRLDFGAAWGGPLGDFKAQWGTVEVPEWLYTTALAPGEHRHVESGSVVPPELTGVRKLVDAAWDRAPLAATAIVSSFALRWL